MTKDTKKNILDNLYLVIYINRVGSDEIDVLEDTIASLELLHVTNITDNDKEKLVSNIKDILSWSDRLGSDEYHILNETIDLINQ